MTSCYYFVFTRPKTGREDEFNHWYSYRHIYDLVAIPGIAAAQRYRLLDRATVEEMSDYLAIYEFVDADLAIAGIVDRRGTDRMPSTDAINRDASKGVVFKPLWAIDDAWRFGRGRLDLFKLGASLNPAVLKPALGVLVANEKQSRPDPLVFDLAYFSADKRGPAPVHEQALSHLSVLISPITDRVTAPA